MNSSIRRTFAIPTACSPVNELLTAIMRSFNEAPAVTEAQAGQEQVLDAAQCSEDRVGESKIQNPKSKIR
jgi:hypothetical protein